MQPQGRVLHGSRIWNGGFATRLPFLSLRVALTLSCQEKELFNEKCVALAFPKDFGCFGVFYLAGVFLSPNSLYGDPPPAPVQSVLIGPQQSKTTLPPAFDKVMLCR